MNLLEALWRGYACLVRGTHERSKGPGVFQGLTEDGLLIFQHVVRCRVCGKELGTICTFDA